MLVNEKTSCDAMPDDAIFALDIGTRTIIGLVGVHRDEQFVVHAAEVVTHESRAMMDGQIHDIAKVAQGVTKVKKSLEKKLGYSLTRVSIAAAGRVLKTCRVRVERDIDDSIEIDGPLIGALEMEAIQKAQQQIENDLSQKEKNQFYCVGYSVMNYFLNDYIITSLLGHKGFKAGVEILATFLPHIVVDSLYSVMERTGLEVTHLTLEPIAALNIAIPQQLRLLNLALVDIGAGTSDIALTKSGTVVAYGMVSIAGDEMTEAIAQNYLVDFNTAESIKLAASNSDKPVVFTDILDNRVSVESKDVIACLQPVIEQLAGTLAEKILEYNGGKAPNAIFLVGGGSQVPGLSEELSKIIGLPKERVAVRNRSIAKNITLEEDTLQGPESITPLGILVTTTMITGQDFYQVTVNGSRVRMYNSRKMTVSDALVLAGFQAEQLICKSGKSMKYVLNSRERTIRGSMGKPAGIYVNGSISNLNAVISPGDELTVAPAENGTDARLQASDLIREARPVYLVWNGHTETIYPKVYINSVQVLPDAVVKAGDQVEIPEEYTLEEIVRLYEMDPLTWDFAVNGENCDGKTAIKTGDRIEGTPKAFAETAAAAPEQEPAKDVFGDPKPMLQKTAESPAQPEGITVLVNGQAVGLPAKSTGYMFIDVFNHIDFDLSVPKGSIVLRLNGKDASYMDVIKNGDVIDIYWG